jgi:Fe-S-cluster containining protein
MRGLMRWLAGPLARGAAPERARRDSGRGCLGCGRCCDSFGGHLQASEADLARWRALGRDDLLARVSAIGWIWIDPATGSLEERCPFLVRTGPDAATCAIHDVKPDICRHYPTLAHGRRCLRGVFLSWSAALAWLGELGGSFPA